MNSLKFQNQKQLHSWFLWPLVALNMPLVECFKIVLLAKFVVEFYASWCALFYLLILKSTSVMPLYASDRVVNLLIRVGIKLKSYSRLKLYKILFLQS